MKSHKPQPQLPAALQGCRAAGPPAQAFPENSLEIFGLVGRPMAPHKSCVDLGFRRIFKNFFAKIFQKPLILTRRIYGILPVNKKKLIKDGFCFDKSEIEKRLQFLIKKRLNKSAKKKISRYLFQYNLS